MDFNNITTKEGILQHCEFWCRFPDAGITGDATLLKQFTARVNVAFDRIMPLLLSYTDHIRWDDTNHSDRPIGKLNMVLGQSDYTITEDDNSLDILNLTAVRILQSATATNYVKLKRATLDDNYVEDFLSPNTDNSGVPSEFLENGNSIFFGTKPSYNATNGIQLFFEREQSYFASTDTEKEPGIPRPFHELLPLYASLDWNRVYRTDDAALKNEIKEEIFKHERNLKVLIDKRNPTRKKITLKKELYI